MNARTVAALAILALALAPGSGSAERDLPAATISLETAAPYYEPFVAVVPPGMPIRWLNPTASPHSVRHDGCLQEGACAFQSAALMPDDSFMIAPLPPGRYAYHCELHPIMRGTLVVLEDPAHRVPSLDAQPVIR